VGYGDRGVVVMLRGFVVMVIGVFCVRAWPLKMVG
jgi:hypothetical protein